MYNTNTINPAYTGSRDVLSVFLLHRNQWIGFDGAPVTNNASITSNIDETNLGAGISFINDNIGPTSENTFSFDLAYFLSLNANYKLSVGLRGTANLFSLDVNKLSIYHQNDPKFQNLSSDFSPNIGSGIYLFSDKTYFGLSIPNFFESKRFDSNQINIIRERMHYYFITGHVFTINTETEFKPALLLKAVEGAPLQMDLSANFLFHKKLTLGLAYRWDAALSALAGFQINNNWFIGYGYDREMTNLANYNAGSHELFIRYELSRSSRISSPRFF
jgi:type IX secretion system PorP/SprF family membrane protein